MKQLTKTGKKFLIGSIAAALVFLASVIMFAISVVKAHGTTDLGFDLTGRDVIKMAVDEDGNRVAGTADGDVFAFNGEGELLWETGKLRDCAVYDIVANGGEVTLVYADGSVISFGDEDARAFSARAAEEAGAAGEEGAKTYGLSAEDGEIEEIYEGAETENFIDSCTVYRLGYQLSGGVAGTQLLKGDGKLFVRARCNDGKWRLFRIENGEAGQVRAPGASRIGGMTLFRGSLYYSFRGQILTEAGEQVLSFDENILALSCGETEISAITESGKLVVYNVDQRETVYDGVLSVAVDTDYVFTTGENFLAKIKNGGVALVDASERGVTLSMAAGNDANFILWNDDCFMLRDTSDVTNPVTIFYSVTHARAISVFSVLRWVFLALAIVALAAAVILFLCVRESMREKIRKGTVSTFKAIWRDRAIYLALLIPFLLLITFYYIPIVLGFSISFLDYVPGERAVFEGFKYFSMVVKNADFWSSVGTMLLFLLADLAKALIPPFIIAEFLILCKLKKFSLWIRILLFLPGILPGVATTLVWQQGIFGPSTNSLVNAFIKLFAPTFTGLNWIYHRSYAVRVLSVVCFGFPWVGSYLIFYGALGGINTSIFEAAKLDGCPWITRVFKIDIPLILSQIKYVVITTFISSVQNYGTLYILYGTGTSDTLRTPALMMYGEIMAGNYNVASVMGVFLFIFLAVVTVLNFRSQKEQIE